MLTFNDNWGGGKKTPKPAYVIHGCSPTIHKFELNEAFFVPVFKKSGNCFASYSVTKERSAVMEAQISRQMSHMGSSAQYRKNNWGQLWATFEGSFLCFHGQKKSIFLKIVCSICTKKVPSMKVKVIFFRNWKVFYFGLKYRTRTIISCGLYIFYSIFKDHFSLFLRRFFQKILSLCMACIQERLVIKSGLWWRAYGRLAVESQTSM